MTPEHRPSSRPDVITTFAVYGISWLILNLVILDGPAGGLGSARRVISVVFPACDNGPDDVVYILWAHAMALVHLFVTYAVLFSRDWQPVNGVESFTRNVRLRARSLVALTYLIVLLAPIHKGQLCEYVIPGESERSSEEGLFLMLLLGAVFLGAAARVIWLFRHPEADGSWYKSKYVRHVFSKLIYVPVIALLVAFTAGHMSAAGSFLVAVFLLSVVFLIAEAIMVTSAKWFDREPSSPLPRRSLKLPDRV